MTTQATRIVAIHGNQLTITTGDAQACGGCASKSACGSTGGRTHRIDVAPALARRLRPGDPVALTLGDGATLRAIAAAYVAPLGGLLAGVAAGSAAGLPDMAVLLCGGSGLCSGYVVSRML
ncbi:MAG: SoxR reducing system RseC family protein, partial [Gammaproteobacteria bacterium]|nr:SoxR reducing system RseC family protein [Gammaproteobacteria bacterium]